MTNCGALLIQQFNILENRIPLPDLTWSIKKTLRFIQIPEIESLIRYDFEHVLKEVMYIEHNYSDDSDDSDEE